MNINPKNRIIALSFGALYTVKAQENLDKIDDIADLKARYSRQRDGVSAYSEMPEDDCDYRYPTTCFVGDDFTADDKIETMLLNKGIDFKRISFGELLASPESIKERVVLSVKRHMIWFLWTDGLIISVQKIAPYSLFW